MPPLPDAIASDPLAGRVDPRGWFGEPDRRFEIEIGSGKGSFLLNHGKGNPGTNLLGIEHAREFYMYTADRVRRSGLSNVRVLHGDGVEFLRWRVPDGIASVIHLYFSDPWPKARHHKRRVVSDRFLAEAHRVLCAGGELRVVTDHDELWEWDLAHFARVTGGAAGSRAIFSMAEFEAPEWVGEGELVGTNYERKMCAPGKKPHAATLTKV